MWVTKEEQGEKEKDIITQNCRPLQNFDRKTYKDAEPGMFLIKEQGEESFLPEKFEAATLSVVKFKLCWNPSGSFGASQDPPFCASIVDNTSIRYNSQEQVYSPGPPCQGDTKKGIPVCPFYNKACAKGSMLFLLIRTEDTNFRQLRMFLKNKAYHNFWDKSFGERDIITVFSEYVKGEKGGYFVANFEKSLDPYPWDKTLLDEFIPKIEESIMGMHNKQS